MNPTTKRNRVKWLATAGAVAALGIGTAGLANAASNDSGSGSTSTTQTVLMDKTSASTSAASGDQQQPVDPASLPNGPGETVLTGDALAKVTAAAEAAYPGATIIRAETDSSGHAYEAHLKLADGTYMTAYFTDTYAADGTDDGFGPGPAGDHGQPPQGQAPAAAQDTSSTAVSG